MRRARGMVLALALGLLLDGCRAAPRRGGTGPVDDLQSARPPITEVLARHTRELLAIPGVVGTGEGQDAGEPVIVVFVVRRTPELEREVPARLEGFRVKLWESGEVTAPPR